MKLASPLSAASFAIFAASSSLAQTALPSAPIDADAATRVEEVIVTAQRRTERLQDVPISVAAISAARLADAAVTGTLDLNSVTPGLNAVAAQGFVKPFLRGVGSTANGPGLEPPNAVYVDGVYYASAPAALFSFNDVERIEVLKGPQGTLFGRNATGGLINVLTRDPRGELAASARATYGNYDYHGADLYLTGPLADGVRASVAAQYSAQDDGYGTNIATGRDAYDVDHDLSLRAKLVVDLGERTVIRLSGDYGDRENTLPSLRPPVRQRALFAAPRSNRPWDLDSDQDQISHFKGGGVSLRAEHDLGFASVMSLSAFRKSRYQFGVDLDASPVPALTSLPLQRDRQFSQELQLLAPSGAPVQWVLGAFYFDAESGFDPQRSLFGGPLAPLPTSVARRDTDGDITTESLAGFAQATVEVLPGTNLTGGLRYTSERRRVQVTRSAVLRNGTVIANTLPPVDDRVTFNRLTWRLSADHRFSPEAMAFLSWNRGFKSGGFNILTPDDPSYDPETIDAYEAGIKTDLADRRVRLNVSGFLYRYRNIQVSRIDNGLVGIFNGATARLYGVDADLEAALGRNFSLNAGAELLRARFRRFPNGFRYVPLGNGGYQPRLNQDLAGNRVPNAPGLTLSLGGDVHATGPAGEFGLGLTAYYNSGYYPEADNTLRQGSYTLVGMTARWRSRDERFSVRLWGKNLLNEVATNQLIATSLSALANYQPPRTYGVTLRFDY